MGDAVGGSLRSVGDSRLHARSIVIVGGTTGLGLSAARACARAGANLVLVGRNLDSAASASEELGSCVRTLVGDASDSCTAANAIELALSTFGRFDGIYHVAGGSGRKAGDGPLHEISDEGWDTTLNHNLKSLFLSNRAAVKKFLDQRTGGAILNMSSVLGEFPSPRYFTTHAYAAAKSAVFGFTRSTAAYYAPHGIRLNVICPALVETPMARRAVGDEEILRFIRTKQPLEGGRAGLPTDLDEAVIFFLSDASRYVTGQTLAVDGGWSVSEGQIDA
jgi:NAD(P)-dependent dehydrogenase (short-subunit alcohol dehydrogenase family)